MLKLEFSIEEALKFGWDKTKQYFWTFFGILLVAGIIAVILSVLSETAKDNPGPMLIIGVINSLFQLFLSMGLIKITVNTAKGQAPDPFDFFGAAGRILHYLGAYVMYLLIVFSGTILLVVPGIIWAIQFLFFSYLVIDGMLGPVAALKKSSQMTRGIKMSLFLFGLICTLINFLGAVCFLIGLFFTIPATSIAYAYVYLKLREQTEAVPQEQ